MVNATVNTYTVQDGGTEEGNLAFPVSVGQKEHPHEDNCVIDTDRSNLSKGTEVKYLEVSFELQANSHISSIKGKTSMTRDKAGNEEWEEVLHRMNVMLVPHSNSGLEHKGRSIRRLPKSLTFIERNIAGNSVITFIS